MIGAVWNMYICIIFVRYLWNVAWMCEVCEVKGSMTMGNVSAERCKKLIWLQKKQSKSNHPYLIRVGRGEEGGLGEELVCYRTNHIKTINSKQSQGIDPIKEKQNDSVPIPSWWLIWFIFIVDFEGIANEFCLFVSCAFISHSKLRCWMWN